MKLSASEDALVEFLEVARGLTIVGSRRNELREILLDVGIRTTEDLSLLSPLVMPEQLARLHASLDSMAVTKIALRRIMRMHGIAE